MLTFTVHEPPHSPVDRIDRAEGLDFVKDGFTWAAALFAPIWMLMHRLWWPLLGYISLISVFEVIRWSSIVSSDWVTLGVLGLHALIGFEADTLRRWSLDNKGWRTLGQVSGRNTPECERRFYEEWLGEQPLIAPPSTPRTLVGAPPRSTPVLGSLQGVRS